ncbi:MAG: NAD(P)-dependent oxidoreductase, partial [Lysobacteraceae bacterium]
MKVAFIGLGNMGGPMAVNLHKAGFDVAAFDLSESATAAVRAQGVAIAASARDAAHQAAVVISMLPASRHVESLYLGDGGVLAGMADAALVIDCSTIAPAVAQKVAQAATARWCCSRS